jgi:hypothetical protein
LKQKLFIRLLFKTLDYVCLPPFLLSSFPPSEDREIPGDKVKIVLTIEKRPVEEPTEFRFFIVPTKTIKVLAEYSFEEWDGMLDE